MIDSAAGGGRVLPLAPLAEGEAQTLFRTTRGTMTVTVTTHAETAGERHARRSTSLP